MKKHYLFVLLCAFSLSSAMPASAGISPELWDTYLAKAQAEPLCATPCPGRLLASASPAFSLAWKHRAMTYEIHYDDQKALGRAVYDLAVHSGDIPASTSREQVERGVQGFHYSMEQLCTWLDDVFAGGRELPNRDTLLLVGYLLKDGVVHSEQGKFKSAASIRHILAAASGAKRSLDDNLRHERLHVLWDEDEKFRQSVHIAWEGLPEAGRAEADKKMKQYANDSSLRLEEWGVREVLAGRLAVPGI